MDGVRDAQYIIVSYFDYLQPKRVELHYFDRIEKTAFLSLSRRVFSPS